MIYTFKDDGRYIVGLPATEVDDEKLTQEQIILLQQGVTSGIYEPKPQPTRTRHTKETLDENSAQSN